MGRICVREVCAVSGGPSSVGTRCGGAPRRVARGVETSERVGSTQNVVVEVLVAGAVLLTGSGAALGAGKMGGAAGRFERSASALSLDDEGNEDEVRPSRQGGKIGG